MNHPKPALLEVKNLSCIYAQQKHTHHVALDNVSFSMYHTHNLGIVGQSGSGKSSLIKSLAKLIPFSSEYVNLEGVRIDHLHEKMFRPFRKNMQLIFQDPHSSFNPYLKLKKSLLEPLYAFPETIPKAQFLEYLTNILEAVGLSKNILHQYPSELSGGMIQRASIARSLLLKPKLILADEPVSSLDAVVQAQIIRLFQQLQKNHDINYLIISHSLDIIKHLCTYTLILQNGLMREYGATSILLSQAVHPYTKQIITNSKPSLDLSIYNYHVEKKITWKGKVYSFYPTKKFVNFTQIQINKEHQLGLYEN